MKSQQLYIYFVKRMGILKHSDIKNVPQIMVTKVILAIVALKIANFYLGYFTSTTNRTI
jgi:hypothetical protein